MAIAFVGAGTGLTVTGASGTVSKTGCTAGNFIVVQVGKNGTTGSPTEGTVTNIENIAGTDNALTLAPGGGVFDVGNPQTGTQSIYYGRVMADGTCSVDISTSGDDFVARVYEFSGVSTDATVANIIDNTASGIGMRQAVGTSTTPTALSPAVTTTGSDRLAIAFVAITGNVATASMTGETGGYDWTEAVAEYAATPATIQIQTADMAASGSVTNGTQTISSSLGWAVDTTAFVPAPVEKQSYYATRRRTVSR